MAKSAAKENCLISSGTAAAFRFTKEIFVPLYDTCECRRFSCRCCYCFQTKYFLFFSQLVPCCCTTHYRGNIQSCLFKKASGNYILMKIPL